MLLSSNSFITVDHPFYHAIMDILSKITSSDPNQKMQELIKKQRELEIKQQKEFQELQLKQQKEKVDLQNEINATKLNQQTLIPAFPAQPIPVSAAPPPPPTPPPDIVSAIGKDVMALKDRVDKLERMLSSMSQAPLPPPPSPPAAVK